MINDKNESATRGSHTDTVTEEDSQNNSFRFFSRTLITLFVDLDENVSCTKSLPESAESAEQHLSMNLRRRSDVYGACLLYAHDKFYISRGTLVKYPITVH